MDTDQNKLPYSITEQMVIFKIESMKVVMAQCLSIKVIKLFKKVLLDVVQTTSFSFMEGHVYTKIMIS